MFWTPLSLLDVYACSHMKHIEIGVVCLFKLVHILRQTYSVCPRRRRPRDVNGASIRCFVDQLQIVLEQVPMGMPKTPVAAHWTFHGLVILPGDALGFDLEPLTFQRASVGLHLSCSLPLSCVFDLVR